MRQPWAPSVVAPRDPAADIKAMLPSGIALRMKEYIIEAILHPVPTSSASPSLFAYYVPPKPKREIEPETDGQEPYGGSVRRAPLVSA